MIPFFDMQARHAPHKEEFMRAIGEVIDSGIFADGPVVERFELEFACYCGTRSAVGVGNGTEAIWLTLLAMGIGPGDEVITVPMTFAATAEAICLAGAKPVFVDIEESTYTLDPALLERAITQRTKAVIPVHLFGQIADMDPIMDIARAHGLRVIEDAAQSHGATYRGKKAGSFADAACFSFYPSKNLGAFGQAGVITTDDEVLAEKLRILKDHGQSAKHRHTLVGCNSRLDAIQAAVLSAKLPHLDRENQSRRQLAAWYKHGFSKSAVRVPTERVGGAHVYHVYAIQTGNRDAVIRALDERCIGHAIHYPVPLHLQPAYAYLGYQPGDFPVSERCADSFLSLPMYPELTSASVSLVVETVCNASRECISA